MQGKLTILNILQHLVLRALSLVRSHCKAASLPRENRHYRENLGAVLSQGIPY